MGLKCPGYPTNQVRLFGLNVNDGFNSDFSKKCFDLFVAGGSQHIAMFQPSTRLFWTQVLPQLSQVYLSLRQSLIVMAMICEPLFNQQMRSASEVLRTDILSDVVSYFNKSLRSFTKEFDTLSIEAKLSCCFMFNGLVMFLHRVAASAAHCNAAYYFLQDYQQQTRDGKALPDMALRNILVPMMKRVLIDASTFTRDTTQLSINPYKEWPYEVCHVPNAFENIESAYECLSNLLKYAIAFSAGQFAQGSVTSLYIQSMIARFNMVLKKRPPTTYNDKLISAELVDFHCRDLMMHHRAAEIIYRCPPSMTEDLYQDFAEDFLHMYQEIAALQLLEPENPVRITLHWIPILFMIATKCRISNLRWDALQMLHNARRAERGWTTCIAYKLARFVIEKEAPVARPNNPLIYVRLLGVTFDAVGELANIRYEAQQDAKRIGEFAAQISLKSTQKIITLYPGMNMPDEVLRAYGYNGTALYAPRIECHCIRDQKSALDEHEDVVKKGTIEEIVVWSAGTVTRHTSQEPMPADS